VLRKIIRRAITHGRLLGQTKPFLHEMAFAVRDLMQDAYPELKESTGRVSRVIAAEESRFSRTMDVGFRNCRRICQGSTGGLATLNPGRDSKGRARQMDAARNAPEPEMAKS